MSHRIERDTMGEMQVPADALYGASTARAVDNFPVSSRAGPRDGDPRLRPPEGRLRRGESANSASSTRKLAEAIIAASHEVAAGQARRALPGRHLPDRLRHLDQHERQRGDRQPRERAPAASASAPRARRAPSIRTTTSTWGSRPTTRSPPRCTSPAPCAIKREADPRARRASPTSSTAKAQGVGRHRQDRPHAPDGRHADPRRPGVRRLRRAGPLRRRPRGPRARRVSKKTCRSAAPPSAPASTRIPSSPSESARPSTKQLGVNFQEADNHFEAQAAKDSFVAAHGRTEDDRRLADQDRQRHPLARQRPALRHLRADAPRDAARQLDHARQGEPGHRRDR